MQGQRLSFFWERSESLEHRPPSSGAHATKGLAAPFPFDPKEPPFSSGASSQLPPDPGHAGSPPHPAVLSPSTPPRQPPRATCSPSAWSRSPPLPSAVPRLVRRSRGACRHFPSVFSVCLRRESGRERWRRAERAHSNTGVMSRADPAPRTP